MIELFLAAAATPLSFDLLCIGSLSRNDLNSPSMFPKVIEKDAVRIYRISLTDKKWCSGDCKETQDLHGVNSNEIVLKDANGVGYEISISVNRESGRMLYRQVIGSEVEVMIAKCQPKQFSGFPKKLF